MSGGFFRGTTADQDTRFSNKHAKLLKSQKFSPELENLVDMTKVKMDVMRPWIAHRVTELLGFEDEVLINFIYGLLEDKVVNGKEIQISLTGFMEKNTGKFMKELWTHLLSAQKNASGVPQQFLDAKEEETRKKQEDMDRITRELKRTKEREEHELEHERVKMDRDADDVRAASLEPHSRSHTKFSSKWSVDKGTNERNGSKGKSRISRSPHSTDLSPSSHRGPRSRSVSKSFSNSKSHSRSRSLSTSPKPLRRSVSSERRRHSLSRRSFTPHRGDSRLRSPSPPQQGASHFRRSMSRSRGRSPSPVRRRLHSPVRHISRSPGWRRSRSPVRRRTRSPLRRRSRSPIQRRSRSPVRRRSRSPVRRRSRSSVRRRSRSSVRRRLRSPVRRRSRSPVRRRSRSPVRRRSRSPVRRRSRSPMRGRSPLPMRRRSRSPIRRRSPSPFRRRSRSPFRRSQSSTSPSGHMSLSPMHSRSLSPVRRRSPSPTRRRYRRDPSTPRQHSPPIRRRATFSGPQRSPSRGSISSSPLRRNSVSPTHGTPPSTVERGSPESLRRSPVQSPKDVHRIVQKTARDRQSPQEEAAEGHKKSGSSGNLPPGSVISLESNPKGHRRSHNEKPAYSPYKSPSSSLSPLAAGRGRSEDRSPVPPKRQREHMNTKERLDSVDVEETTFSRVKEDKRENKYPVDDKYEKVKHSPEKLPSHHSRDAQVQKRKSKNDDERRNYPELSGEPLLTRKDLSSDNKAQHTEKEYKADEMNHLHASDVKGSLRHREAAELPKSLEKGERLDQSGSLDSGSEESDGVNKKRKRKRSKRKDATSDEDDSHDSHTESRKEAKRRRKEEKRLKKEEKRRRREERRRRKDDRRTEKLRLKAGRNVHPSSDPDKTDDSHASDAEPVRKRGEHVTDNEAVLSDQKKLEIELREKALESLRAKKGIGH